MTVNYSDLKPSLQTGDLILFSAHFFISEVIKAITGSPYSHIGMIANYPGVDGLCFWEATTNGTLQCMIDQKPHAGVHLVSLEALLAYYGPYVNNTFIFRQLKVERTPEMQAAFNSFAPTTDGRPFEGDFDMFEHWIEGRVFKIPSPESEFDCSQLFAETYQKMGLLPLEPPPNAYIPKDFSSQVTNLPLLLGSTMTDEITVIWDGQGQPG